MAPGCEPVVVQISRPGLLCRRPSEATIRNQQAGAHRMVRSTSCIMSEQTSLRIRPIPDGRYRRQHPVMGSLRSGIQFGLAKSGFAAVRYINRISRTVHTSCRPRYRVPSTRRCILHQIETIGSRRRRIMNLCPRIRYRQYLRDVWPLKREQP